MRSTLVPSQWYAAEMIGEAFGPALRHDRPIHIEAIRPSHTGWPVFERQCCHANNHEGIRTKRYTLNTRERGERFLLAKRTYHIPPRLLLAHEIIAEWLWAHVRLELSAECDVDTWLNRHI
jgi:hypothetical protein